MNIHTTTHPWGRYWGGRRTAVSNCTSVGAPVAATSIGQCTADWAMKACRSSSRSSSSRSSSSSTSSVIGYVAMLRRARLGPKDSSLHQTQSHLHICTLSTPCCTTIDYQHVQQLSSLGTLCAGRPRHDCMSKGKTLNTQNVLHKEFHALACLQAGCATLHRFPACTHRQVDTAFMQPTAPSDLTPKCHHCCTLPPPQQHPDTRTTLSVARCDGLMHIALPP